MSVRGLIDFLGEASDPRRDYGNERHRLVDILVIGLCSTICGGKSFEDMEVFGETREEWLGTFLELPTGFRAPIHLCGCSSVWKVENCSNACMNSLIARHWRKAVGD